MAKIQLGKHGLKQTQGQFKLKGLITGTSKDDALKSTTQSNGKERNTLKFGVRTSDENEIYVKISDSEKDDAYFYKKADKKAGTEGETKKVAWEKRLNFHEEGFTPIGVAIGLEKNEEGKNIIVNRHDFDAAPYLYDLISDDMPVRVIGELEFSSFDGKEGKIRSKNLNIKKIYNSVVNFEDEDFVEDNSFKQSFIFISVDKAKKDGKDDTEDPRFIVKGKVVTYSGIEDVEFVIRNKKLALNFKKRLKPYYCISCFGHINNKRQEEEIENNANDDWGGESDPFEFVSSPRKFEFEISGIDGKSIDKETYSEQIINDALKADSEFGDDDWGGENQEASNETEDENDEYDW